MGVTRFDTGSDDGSGVWFDFRAADGVLLRGTHRSTTTGDSGLAIVVSHGFTGSMNKPALRGILERLSEHAGVVAYDSRGHGRSEGLSTVGGDEVLDLDAAVAVARRLGYERIASLGFSMGGASAIRHAALHGIRTHEQVDAVATVGAVSRWYRVDTAPMRRLHWTIQTRLGRRVARRLLNTRVAVEGWSPEPTPPDELVARIAPVPLLLIHGDQDPYLTLDNARDLYAAAGSPVALWVWAGFGHAESAMTTERTDRVGTALVAMARGLPIPAEASR